ncbi:MAG: hypothetical protein ACRDYA_23000 [Egibacteraceae bacterium]
MSAQTTAAQPQCTTAEDGPGRPYGDYSAVQLFESLEVQHDKGTYSPDLVWELAMRACELEQLQRRISDVT